MSKLQTLLVTINKINPVEHVTNFATKMIGGNIIAKKLLSEMESLTDNLIAEMHDMIAIEYIVPLERQIGEMQANVQRAQEERKALKQSHETRLKDLQDDIMNLRKQILGA